MTPEQENEQQEKLQKEAVKSMQGAGNNMKLVLARISALENELRLAKADLFSANNCIGRNAYRADHKTTWNTYLTASIDRITAVIARDTIQ